MNANEREVVVAIDYEGLVRGVKQKMADGFTPFGPRIVFEDESANPSLRQFYQAVHKSPPGVKGAPFVNLTGLISIEWFICSYLFQQPCHMTSLPHLIKAYEKSWKGTTCPAAMLFNPGKLIFAIASLEKFGLIYSYKHHLLGVVLLRLSIRAADELINAPYRYPEVDPTNAMALHRTGR